MNNLILKLKSLIDSEIKEIIDNRIIELEQNRNSQQSVFIELCFCLMTANFNAKRAIEIQKNIGQGFINYDFEKLKDELKRLGHRFPNARAKYIHDARNYQKDIWNLIEDKTISEQEKRLWLKKNIKGLGLKESSHFLRNLGFLNVSIIDFHIIDLLNDNNLINGINRKNFNEKKYFEVEQILKNIAKEVNLDLSRLDFYLWYIETGTILK